MLVGIRWVSAHGGLARAKRREVLLRSLLATTVRGQRCTGAGRRVGHGDHVNLEQSRQERSTDVSPIHAHSLTPPRVALLARRTGSRILDGPYGKALPGALRRPFR